MWSLKDLITRQLGSWGSKTIQGGAFLAPDTLPEEPLVEGASELGPLLQPLATAATRFHDAIGIVLRSWLLKRNTQERMLFIHRLVQAVLKEGVNKQTQRQWSKRTVRAVSLAFPDAIDVKAGEQYERYPPSLPALTNHLKKPYRTDH